jgi:FkbM family methyltransferase
MRISELVVSSLNNYRYFRRLHIARKKKLLVFLTLIKIISTYLILVKFLRLPLKSSHILGMKVEAYDYEAICFLFNEIFFRGEYAFEIQKPTPLIFDCGANIGMATLFFKWLYPDAIVYSFEPDPHAYALLRKNILSNGLSSVQLYNVALTDIEGDVTFYSDETVKGSLRSSLFAERKLSNAITVKGQTLSHFVGSLEIDFLKIDVEGAETIIFNDLSKTARMTNVQQMVVEYHHHITPADSDLAQFLANLEASGFEYQLDSKCIPLCSQGQFQDVIIYSYRLGNAA